MKTVNPKKPPVLVLGGTSNALAIARALGRQGIRVYLAVLRNTGACYTRYAGKIFPIPSKDGAADYWGELLLASNSASLHGSVIFPCNDDAIEFAAKFRKELENHYILDESIPDLQLLLINKRKTMELTRSIGLPTPKFTAVECPADLQKVDGDFKFPLIVKPQQSHVFKRFFPDDKLFIVNSPEELQRRLQQVLQYELKVIISEFIPGPDSLLGSYYTYIDARGNTLFHYTKKVLRRFPKNNGPATYHITDWDPEIAELGLKFFRGINFRGLGNVEFKRDLRDGQLKIIECNPRFTAAHELLVRCGMDTSLILYNHLAGLPLPAVNSYKQRMTLWFPSLDYKAYKELKGLKEITFWSWFKSVARPQVFPHFRWFDPLPTVVPFLQNVRKKVLR